jgi:hypothetical protein
MSKRNDTTDKFDKFYYDQEYFAELRGKKFKRSDGSEDTFGYRNPEGEWLGCDPIVRSWKTMFNPTNMLDVGCARGTFIGYARSIGINAVGFDFSEWAIEHPHPRCQKEWTRVHDATQTYPYSDNSFDLVTILDFMEHLFEDQVDSVIKEVYRVSNRFAFFLIATIGSGSGVNIDIHDKGYILKKGEKIPVELEGYTAAGHVTVCTREWWEDKLMKLGSNDNNSNTCKKWNIRHDLENEFRRLVPSDILANWKTIIILDNTKQAILDNTKQAILDNTKQAILDNTKQAILDNTKQAILDNTKQAILENTNSEY